MSVTLGRWPLIPEQHCTASLPNGIIGTQISDTNAPNVFCERRLQIELTNIAFQMLTSDHGRPSTDPVIIDKHIRRLKEEFIEQLPPAFRLHNPDEKWDDELPNLKRQREMLRISIYVTTCSLLRPVIVQSPGEAQTLSTADRDLVAEHRASIVDVTIEMLESVGRLHMLMGGKHNRFFLLSFFTLEPAVLLGMCLMNPQAGKKRGKQGSSASVAFPGNQSADEEQWKRGRKSMGEAAARLQMLSEVSSIARIGVKVLNKMVANIDDRGTATLLNRTKQDQYTCQTSSSSSRLSAGDLGLSQPRILSSAESLTAATIPSPSCAVIAREASSTSTMSPYSQHSHPNWESQFLRGSSRSSVGGLDLPNLTYDLADWGLDLVDAFPLQSSHSFANADGSNQGPPEPMVTTTGSSAHFPQSTHEDAPSYENIAWPLGPHSWAWDTLASTINPALSMPYIHPQFPETSTPIAMGQEYDWGLSADQHVVSFER